MSFRPPLTCHSDHHFPVIPTEVEKSHLLRREIVYWVYILTNKFNNVLYIGVTNDLQRRVFEHKNKLVEGFTQKYNVDKLVYYESTEDVESAILREKQLKNWRKEKKLVLIERMNPKWLDLSKDIY